MAWVVDTSVLLDIRIGHPENLAISSAECLQRNAADGLVICPVTFIEMSPAFHGDIHAERNWLDALNISNREPWLERDTEQSHSLWNGYIQRKRQNTVPKRPIADIFIAGFALRFQGLITRNETDFRTIAPNLALVVPPSHP